MTTKRIPSADRSHKRQDPEQAHHAHKATGRACSRTGPGGTGAPAPEVRPMRGSSVSARRRALLYSGRPRHGRGRWPANQEVSDRASRAHRPSREATERPDDGDPPRHRRRDAGEVYPGPRPLVRGLLLHWAARLGRRPRRQGRLAGLMPATVIVGLQWGDEGKGKTTDFLAEQVAMVVRYQGGDNAGHTVVSGDEVFKLRLMPSGVLYPAHHVGHRQRRRGQPGDADRRAGHAQRRAGSTSSRSGSAAART